jgi:hypothetical protein
MRRTTFGIAILGALLVTAAADAQTPSSSAVPANRGSFGIAPFAGYLVSESLMDGPLNTSLGGVSAPLYGAQASLPLAAGASLVGTIGYASGDLEVGVPLIGGMSVGDSQTWIVDAAVELRPDSWAARGHRFVPILHFGGGALRRELSVAGFSARSTDLVVSVGLGADFPVAPNVAIRVMAKDHYGKADFGSVGPVNGKTDDLHTFALSAGLRFAF